MSIPLIRTKLFIPPLRESVIPRSSIVDQVISNLSRKFTLISAPAGFGKTTLLCEFAQQVNRPVAWVSIDNDDNDLTRFLTYFISSLATISDGFVESILNALESEHPLNEDLILAGIINDIVEIPNPFVVILDDYHIITNPKIHDFLTNIIENQPAEMHLVIATRSDPPWPLARWRVRQEMTELRVQDLRFSLDEATIFLNDAMQLGLSADSVSKLDARTEGWIAGLLMAAISLQGKEDTANFIQTFEGSHRFIFDYLVEEVFNQLPPESQDFLIRTSLLDQLCAPLCNAFLGISDSQSILHQLEVMNLFIVPLDEQRYWYRYHQLFSDLLSSYLMKLPQAEIVELHLRASVWYENNDALFDAIQHAFKAGDIERVAQLIEINVLGIFDRGEVRTLTQFIKQLPEESLVEYPWLQIARAWDFTLTGAFDEAARCLVSTENVLLEKPEKQTRHIYGHIAAIQSYIELLSSGDYKQGVALAQNALDLLPAEDLRTRGMAYVTLGTMQRVNQHPVMALETLQSALEIYQTRNQPYVIIDILSQLARAYREQGLLHETARLCQEALDTAQQYANGKRNRFPNIAYTMGVLGRVYYEWDQLDKAIEIGLEGLSISERWGQANTLLGSYLFLARIYRVQNKFQEALDAIQAAKNIGSRFSEAHEFVIRTHEMLIHLAMGNLDIVEDWVKVSSQDFETNQDERLWELAPLTVALYHNKQIVSLDELGRALDRLSGTFIENQIQRRVMMVYIQKAVVYHMQKKYDQSLSLIEKALSLGKGEGYVRSFTDHGPLMEAILKKAIIAGIEVDYANQLLAHLQIKSQPEKAHPQSQKSDALIDDLTNREIEVLRLLSTDLTIPKIAEDLSITVGTLRTHIKRIYHKLDAHSRFEAISKAKNLDIG